MGPKEVDLEARPRSEGFRQGGNKNQLHPGKLTWNSDHGGLVQNVQMIFRISIK